MAVSRALLRQRVVDDLRAKIASGQLALGHRLLEADVVRAYAVSRSPARFALEMLRAEGLVAPAPGRGYIVGALVRPGSAAPRAQLPEGKITSEPAWERIYARVERDVATSILFRSVRIQEARLATRFGVSRTVARDVLARMHANGLISKERGGRWRADRITAERIRDLYELRWLLEPHALLEVGPRVAPETWSQMLDRIDEIRLKAAEARATDLDRVERDLHITVLGECRNRELVRVLRRTQLLLIANRYMFDQYLGAPHGMTRASLDEHRKVIALAKTRRFEDAARALERHLKQSLQHWVLRLERIGASHHPPRARYLSAAGEPA